MTRGLAVALTVGVGALIALQAPVNARLGHAIGTWPAATVSFFVGTVGLLVVTAVAGDLGHLGDAPHQPWWYLIGGLLGAALVSVSLVTVRTLGAGGLTAATIAGQLVLSMVVDQLGWLGVARQPITAAKLAGVALLAAGVFLIVRD